MSREPTEPNRVIINAGAHDRPHGPVRMAWPHADTPIALVTKQGDRLTVQRDDDALAFLLPALEVGAEIACTPAYGPDNGTHGDSQSGVRMEDSGATIHILLDGAKFTAYHYANVPARPYFWPVLAPGDIPVTRAWPMSDDVPGETRDHPHHRSLYFAYGDVNGTDNWSEEQGHGHTEHRSVDELVSGPVFGRFSTTSDWTDNEGMALLEQKVTVTVWRGTPTDRLLDIDLRLTPRGIIRFGDTKEGGMVTVRVASALDVPRGGRITNAYGGIDEGETWGKAAHWCDYSGTIDGQAVGIAVMDHPDSFRYPTYWHVRNYGLMAANPFALNDYTQGARNGSYLLKSGETLRFRYRLLVHRGDAETGDVRNHYLNFVAPPKAILEG